MAAIEFSEETKRQVERIGSADLVVGIAGAVAPEELRVRAEQIVAELGSSLSALRIVFAWAERTGQRLPGKWRRRAGNRGRFCALYITGSGERRILGGGLGPSASGAGAGGVAQCSGLHCAGSGSGGTAGACAPALRVWGSRPAVRAGHAHLSGRQVRRADQHRGILSPLESGAFREKGTLSARVRFCSVGRDL